MASAKNIHWNHVLAGLYILVGLSLAGCCYLDSTELAALVFEEGHSSIEQKPPILAPAPFAQGLLSKDSGVCVCGLKVTFSPSEALLSCLREKGRLLAVQRCKQFPSALVQAILMNLVSK